MRVIEHLRSNPAPFPQVCGWNLVVLLVIQGKQGSGAVPGWVIREEMKDTGLVRRGPAFYRAMQRLEDAGLVGGTYARTEDASRERFYWITEAGVEQVRRAVGMCAAVVETAKETEAEPPNVAMGDALMGVFGYKRADKESENG